MRKQIPEWLERLGSYYVLGAPLKRWPAILLALVFIGGLIVLNVADNSSPTTSKAFAAEVIGLWTSDSGIKSGTVRTDYLVRLKQDDEESVCAVSPVMIQQWHQLEIGRTYEFSVTLAGRHCFIQQATAINSFDPPGEEN